MIPVRRHIADFFELVMTTIAMAFIVLLPALIGGGVLFALVFAVRAAWMLAGWVFR